MAIFLTEYRDHQGKRWCGPDVHANTWKEAKQILESLKKSIVISGPLLERIDSETGERIVFPPPEDDPSA